MASGGKNNLEQDYKDAGFGGTLGFGQKPALLMIDWVMAYLDQSSPLYAGVEAELTIAVKLLAAARQAGIPILHTRVEYEPGGADGGHFYKKVKALENLQRGNPLGNFHADVEPEDGEAVFTKQYASGFFGTALADKLQELKCDTAIISGLTTSGCVRATALDALQNGFIPIVVEDACGDRDQRVQDANLFDLQAKYAEVVSSNAVMDYLAGI